MDVLFNLLFYKGLILKSVSYSLKFYQTFWYLFDLFLNFSIKMIFEYNMTKA